MAKLVDCRGQACPQPVIRTKKAIAESARVTTIVDNRAALANVSRLAEKEGCAVDVEKKDDGIYLHLSRTGSVAQTDTVLSAATGGVVGPLVVLIPSDGMGRGDEELGGILMRSFLHALNEVEPLPNTIILINSGVKLTAEGSVVLEDLRALQHRGVEILACGTCLDFFGLKDKIAVGHISNMYSIAETLLGAGKVVAL
jgi:selenium metabolism protein YedF